MSVQLLARAGGEVSVIGFVLCAAALVVCSLARELRTERAGGTARRVTAPRVMTAVALLTGSLALVATLVRLLATAYTA